MILFRLIDPNGFVVEGSEVVLNTTDFRRARAAVEPLFAHLRSYGYKLRLNYI